VKDLRRVFGAVPEADAPACVLLQLEGSLAGIAVDQVLRIEDAPDEDFDAVVEDAALPIHAVVRVRDLLLPVITVDRLLPPLSA
jgi:chemotaxis signal transduction protein